MNKKGKCEGCDREDVGIMAHGLCASCYPLYEKYKGSIDKIREFRKEHPVRERNSNKKGKIKFQDREYMLPEKVEVTKEVAIHKTEKNGFAEILIKAFAVIDQKQEELKQLRNQVSELETKIIQVKQQLLISRAEVIKISKAKLEESESITGMDGL